MLRARLAVAAVLLTGLRAPEILRTRLVWAKTSAIGLAGSVVRLAWLPRAVARLPRTVARLGLVGLWIVRCGVLWIAVLLAGVALWITTRRAEPLLRLGRSSRREAG